MLPNARTMPIWANSRYVGIISTWIGIITVATTARNAMPRPANLRRAKPYPASEHSTRWDTTAMADTNTVLPSHCSTWDWLIRVR